MSKSPMRVHGMHGLGDNIHIRAIVRQLMERYEVWLDTSWFSVFHDLAEQGLHVRFKHTFLRTQQKNALREMARFSQTPIPPRAAATLVRYRPRADQTVLEAMCAVTGTDYSRADYRLPIRPEWRDAADALFSTTKPICVYRPLTVRSEWQGNEKRNPDANAYAELFGSIRDRFYVVSLADLERGREWMIGTPIQADLEIHDGSLPFETMAGLFTRANLVVTPGGFATILAPAVSTPVISILGGYERAHALSTASRFAPYLGIEPINPCSCMMGQCQRRCNKRIDVDKARHDVKEFVDNILGSG